MKIALITTMYKRHELTDFVFAHYQRIKSRLPFTLELCVAGSEGKHSLNIAMKNGFHYVDVENRPLNQKHNAVLDLARQLNPDGVVLIGSDDMLSLNMFSIYHDMLYYGEDVFGFSDMYFYDRQMYHWKGYQGERKNEMIGAGRMFSSKVLNDLNWNLWGDDELNSGLDKRCMDRLSTVIDGYLVQPIPDEHMMIGIKAGQSITPINEMSNIEMITREKLRYLGTDLKPLNRLYE